MKLLNKSFTRERVDPVRMKFRRLPATDSDSNRILSGKGICNLRGIMRGGESSTVTNRHRRCNGVSVARTGCGKLARGRLVQRSKRTRSNNGSACSRLRTGAIEFECVSNETRGFIAFQLPPLLTHQLENRPNRNRNDFLAAVDNQTRSWATSREINFML